MRQILFKIGKKFYGDFSDVATGLWRGLFEPYAMLRVVPAFQTGQKVHRNDSKSRRSSTSMDDDHFEKVFPVICQKRGKSIKSST